MLPKPNADGLALVQISGTADEVEALFEALVSSTDWEPVTTIRATPEPFEDDTHAQTWAVYLRPDPYAGHTPETVDTTR